MRKRMLVAAKTLIVSYVALTGVSACAPSGPPAVSVSIPVTQPGQGTLPAVSGAGVHALWAGAQWGDLTVSDGMVLGDDYSAAGAARVDAARAATGVLTWAATLPGSLPDILGLLPAGKVVVVGAGHDFGHAPEGVIPAVTDYIALDQATGRQLWSVPADGSMQWPPIAAAGNLVLTTDRTGTVTARRAATGVIAWRASWPAGCAASQTPAPGDPFFGGPGVALTADGALITASFECDSGPAVVVRLAPTTGKPLWTWRQPAGITNPGQASVIGAAQDGNTVLVATPAAPSSTRAYQWAAALSASNQDAVVLALDAASGHPRWSAPDGPDESFVMTDGATCMIFQSVRAGAECRDDTSGADTMPALITTPGAAPGGTAIVPFIGDGLVVTTVPAHGGFIVRITRVRGSATEALARLAISVVADQEPSYQPSATASGPLQPGRTLLLLQPAGHTETLAIAVPTPA